jgi:hypothetical protein
MHRPAKHGAFHTSLGDSRQQHLHARHLLRIPHLYISGGTELSTLVTSLGVIVLFARERTCEPFRSRCSPIETFQLSDSSIRKTYFLLSASRTHARKMWRCFEACWPVYR